MTDREIHAARKKACQTAFAQTLRAHAIPSDWMECHPVRGASGNGRTRLHIQFVVNDGGPTLLPHTRALESTFRRHLAKLDSDAGQWIDCIAWILDDAPLASATSSRYHLSHSERTHDPAGAARTRP